MDEQASRWPLYTLTARGHSRADREPASGLSKDERRAARRAAARAARMPKSSAAAAATGSAATAGAPPLPALVARGGPTLLVGEGDMTFALALVNARARAR